MKSIATAVLLGFCCFAMVGAADLHPTPQTGEGPFFPPGGAAQADNDLITVEGAKGKPQGEPIEIVGTVTNTKGEPLSGAVVVIWQTDIWGKYNHPREDRTDAAGKPMPLDPAFQYVGRAIADARGAYRFRTIVPGSYGRRPKHVHFKITHPGYRPLATEMQFEGDPYIEGDGVTGDLPEDGHAQIIVKLEPPAAGSDARVARFPIVLER